MSPTREYANGPKACGSPTWPRTRARRSAGCSGGTAMKRAMDGSRRSIRRSIRRGAAGGVRGKRAYIIVFRALEPCSTGPSIPSLRMSLPSNPDCTLRSPANTGCFWGGTRPVAEPERAGKLRPCGRSIFWERKGRNPDSIEQYRAWSGTRERLVERGGAKHFDIALATGMKEAPPGPAPLVTVESVVKEQDTAQRRAIRRTVPRHPSRRGSRRPPRRNREAGRDPRQSPRGNRRRSRSRRGSRTGGAEAPADESSPGRATAPSRDAGAASACRWQEFRRRDRSGVLEETGWTVVDFKDRGGARLETLRAMNGKCSGTLTASPR